MAWSETKLILDAVKTNGIQSGNGTLVMVPMNANKYGYNLRMMDIDGVTPLNDVKITGVSDISTEVRTNKNGIAKFISDSPAHTVSFSEFPAGYLYADLYPQQSIRGYINDMTEIIVSPKVSDWAGYNVTLKEKDGSPVRSKQVTCTTNGKTYTTNSAGTIAQTIYAKSNTMTFEWKLVEPSSDGIVAINATNIYGASVSGAIGSVTTVTAPNGAFKRNDSVTYKITASRTIGSEITIGSKKYIIAHDDGTNVFAVLKTWEKDVVFHSSSVDYAQSSIKNDCASWYNSQVPATWRTTYNFFNRISVEGVTAECFIPSYQQANGGWNYFNSNDRRIFRDGSNTAKYWWTSTGSTSSNVWFVRTVGSFGSGSPSNTYGFRPALAIKRSAFAT